MPNPIRPCWFSLWLIVLAVVPSFGDEPSDEDSSTKRLAGKLVEQIHVERQSGDQWSPAPRVPDPVLTFGDATRNNSNGSVWVWGEKGRPQAVMEVYRLTDRPDDWLFVVNNTSGSTIRSTRNNGQWWQPNESTLTMQRIPQDQGVHEGSSGRLLQMKALARRFDAHEFWDPNNSRFELRLLAQPLHRYSDDEGGIVDGALFAHANGTNPEVLLLIEARRSAEGATEWQYGLARLGHAEMHVSFDDKEVWTNPRVGQLAPNEPYWMHYETIPNID